MDENMAEDEGQQWLTVDELAAATNMTVRTARYYAGLGLIPPPRRRGRVAYYSPIHRARLEMIRALQDHGFTLAAIEKHLQQVRLDASVEELAIHQAVLTSGGAGSGEVLDAVELENRIGRPLRDSIEGLVAIGALRQVAPGSYELLPSFEVGVRALELDIPLDSLVLAGQSISTHMDHLVDELTNIFQHHVVQPYRQRSGEDSPEDAEKFQATVTQLQQLTLEAVLAGFQLAVHKITTRSSKH